MQVGRLTTAVGRSEDRHWVLGESVVPGSALCLHRCTISTESPTYRPSTRISQGQYNCMTVVRILILVVHLSADMLLREGLLSRMGRPATADVDGLAIIGACGSQDHDLNVAEHSLPEVLGNCATTCSDQSTGSIISAPLTGGAWRHSVPDCATPTAVAN